jgi:exodeoxyribonuclease V beta subunit
MSASKNSELQLDLAAEELINGLVIEASAGTGKTYSVSALVAREIALREDLRIGNILITTFTRNAAAELRDRVRRRIVEIADQLEANTPDENDAISVALSKKEDSQSDIIRRLRRAVVEFDTATISTIHAVCNKVLGLAGLSTMQVDGEDATGRLVLEAVNDALIEASMDGRIIADGEQKKLVELVQAKIGAPKAGLWYSSEQKSPEQIATLNEIIQVVNSAVKRVQEKSQEMPSYNDLLRRATEVVVSGKYPGVVQAFKERFSLAFVDEAQDTDMLQWELFTKTFETTNDSADERALVTVGDPKQAIYGFRGADVASYVAHRENKPMRSLAQNQRSDEFLVDGLNALFQDSTFGPGIDYIKVSTPERHKGSVIQGTTPLQLIDVGNLTNQGRLSVPVAKRIAEILKTCSISSLGGKEESPSRRVQPQDICVLVTRKAVGRDVERELRRLGIPAVSNGTESVMKSQIALSIRALLEAMDRISDVGKIRVAVATPFFGFRLTDDEIRDDGQLTKWQEEIAVWGNVLRRSGVAAFGAAILRDNKVAQSLTSTSDAERYLADFAHVSDLLHEYTKGKPCSPARALEVFGQLQSIEELSEVVSRRVESDSAAVQIMTVHSAKGLQFPVVVVADLWKPKDKRINRVPIVTTKSPTGVSQRLIDVGWVLGSTDPGTIQRIQDAADQETRRLLYVALTRAEHHLSVLYTSGVGTKAGLTPSIFDLCTNVEKAVQLVDKVERRGVDALAKAQRYRASSESSQAQLELANAPASVVQSYRRTSFTGITKRQEAREGNSKVAGFIGEESGQDESLVDMSLLGVGAHQYAANDVPAGLPEGVDMPLARVPGGTYFGRVMHKVYEVIDTSKDLREEVTRAIDIHASSALLRPFRDQLIEGVIASYRTPLGMPFNGMALADIAPIDRLSELEFEMSLANLSKGVLASDIGKALKVSLETDDLLYAYADSLSDSSFDIPLAGLLNGSIDAMIRVHAEDGSPRLFITDYKTNRLDGDEDVSLIEAYAPERLVAAMEHHHYPLQALLYGTAIYRMLRWRQPALNADEVIAGVAYFFVRGMVGVESPKDADDMPYGVFQWKAPVGLWEKLSNLFAGDRP